MVNVWSDSTVVNGYGVVSKTAKNATILDIDPQEVEAACQNIIQEAKKSFSLIGDKIIQIKCGQETLAAEDSSMQPVLEETGAAVKKLCEQISPIVEEIQELAMDAHDKLQTQYNNDAKIEFNAQVTAAQNSVAASEDNTYI